MGFFNEFVDSCNNEENANKNLLLPIKDNLIYNILWLSQ